MHKPASPLDWRESGDGYTVVDAQGVRVCGVPNGEDRVYIIEAANAYPRLRAALDKALEACRRLLQADGLYARASEAVREGPDWSDEYSAAASSAWRQAVRLAREALEMAKECDRRGDA